jgi:hypothetical protein
MAAVDLEGGAAGSPESGEAMTVEPAIREVTHARRRDTHYETTVPEVIARILTDLGEPVEAAPVAPAWTAQPLLLTTAGNRGRPYADDGTGIHEFDC